MSLDIFSENILDYYRNPRNKGGLQKPDLQAADDNPSCGDKVLLQLELEKSKIVKARFQGTGCAISQASASMLCEKLEGMAIKHAVELSPQDILEMLGVAVNGQRLKCALLSLHVLKMSLKSRLGVKVEDDYFELQVQQ